MRIDLNDYQSGAYVEILDSIPWKVLRVASRMAGKNNSAEETELVNNVTLKTMIRFWNVKDTLGADVPIPKEASEEQLDMVDGLLVTKILGEIMNLTKRVKVDPNSGNA